MIKDELIFKQKAAKAEFDNLIEKKVKLEQEIEQISQKLYEFRGQYQAYQEMIDTFPKETALDPSTIVVKEKKDATRAK